MSDSELQTIVAQEEHALKQCLKSIDLQIDKTIGRLYTEEQRSREMSSEIVATKRNEDKALLMSDEQVAHKLRDQQQSNLETLEKQKEKPYFARLVLLEETPQGEKEIEYRLGQFSNSDCRIVDWRNAPISRIYYEYTEGEDYCEEIQGRERLGKIKLRNAVDIVKSELKSIKHRGQVITKTPTGWQSNKISEHNLRDEQGSGYQALPSILPLITAEQYQLITSDPQTSIIIQGIAGSGKTTVALHRLSWLLHQKDLEISPQSVLVISRSELLKSYILNSAQKLDLENVRVITFYEWLEKISKEVAELKDYTFSKNSVASSLTRVLNSASILEVLEETAQQIDFEEIPSILTRTADILERDQTKLLSKDLLQTAYLHLKDCFAEKYLSGPACTLVLRFLQIKNRLPKYDHLILDEAQDYWPAELKLLISSVAKDRAITAVGDTSQNIFSATNNLQKQTSDWRELLKVWWKQEENLNYISLNVSHRNTIEIMNLAQHVQNIALSKNGKHGRIPIWFDCLNEADAIRQAQEWLMKANNLYPMGIHAVICADSEQASQTYKFLQNKFGSGISLVTGKNWSDSGIVVLSVKQSKGLEFTNVLVWDVSNKNYPNSEISRNMLYTAITRAENNLSLITWNSSSPLLPPKHSKLLRYAPSAE